MSSLIVDELTVLWYPNKLSNYERRAVMNIKMPERVSYIISKLIAAGYEAYSVGGCVRDSILNRIPNDWDITTSATPEEVKAIFRPTIDTGIKHGTVTILLDHVGYEVTTYRIDGNYSDSRHPDNVTFTRSLTEDLRRRDFTINAMAYNNEDGVVDPFDGTGDLAGKVIRCVGDPYERFTEDALRILRAVRFAAQLGFTIDSDTLSAAAALAPTLSKVSAERIHAELNKLLLSDHPELIKTLLDTGIADVVLPGLRSCKSFDRLISDLCACVPGRSERWAVLTHHLGNGEELMKGLRFDNLTINRVLMLNSYTDASLLSLSVSGTRRLINKLGKELLPAWFDYMDAIHHNGSTIPTTDVRECVSGIIERNECTCLKELAVSGRELMALGCPAGTLVGSILNKLLEIVLDDPGKNTAECLKEEALALLDSDVKG